MRVIIRRREVARERLCACGQLQVEQLSDRENRSGGWRLKGVSWGKLNVSLRFEQQRFYNPHHHPEMPRTLQSLDRRVGHGEDYNRMLYDQVMLRLRNK
jgi:hypothetical protein